MEKDLFPHGSYQNGSNWLVYKCLLVQCDRALSAKINASYSLSILEQSFYLFEKFNLVLRERQKNLQKSKRYENNDSS